MKSNQSQQIIDPKKQKQNKYGTLNREGKLAYSLLINHLVQGQCSQRICRANQQIKEQAKLLQLTSKISINLYNLDMISHLFS